MKRKLWKTRLYTSCFFVNLSIVSSWQSSMDSYQVLWACFINIWRDLPLDVFDFFACLFYFILSFFCRARNFFTVPSKQTSLYPPWLTSWNSQKNWNNCWISICHPRNYIVWKNTRDRPGDNILTKRRNAGLVCKEGITNRCSKNFRSGTKFLVRKFTPKQPRSRGRGPGNEVDHWTLFIHRFVSRPLHNYPDSLLDI